MTTEHLQDLPAVRPETWKEKEEEGVYPVQQVAAEEPITDSEVKEAVCELNPDKNSLDSRG